MPNRLLVIGGVAAGMSAAAKAKRTDRQMEVVVYEKSPFISYGACGMPYYVAGDVEDHRSLLARTPEQMAERGVEVHVRHEVTAIDPAVRTATVRDLAEGREFTTPYDTLVVATGAAPIRPSLPGADLEGIFVLRQLDDGRAIRDFVTQNHPQRAVVVGGGYVGVEMAETFRRLGLDVTMLIRSGQVMRTTLDEEIRVLVEEELARQGVEIVTGAPTRFEGQGRVEAVVADGDRYPCDVALVGIGVRPVVGVAQAAGVALGRTGAIATDETGATNLPGVYAAGDCAQAFHLVADRPEYLPLGSTANKQGRVAGENIGGGQATFGGIVGTMIVRAFDLAAASTGLSTAQARELGYTVRTSKIQAKDTPHYFPGASDIHIQLIIDEETDRLLGGQIVARPSAAKRIDVLATALHHRFTVSDLQRLDLAYAPPFSPVWDPLLVAANVAAK